MKNILDEKPLPFAQLHGRCRFSCNFIPAESFYKKRILDIGCGFGWLELYALKFSPHSIVAIDYNAANLKTARSSINDMRIGYIRASAIELPFSESSFDTICIWDVIEHLPKGSERILFKEMDRVLRPNGKIYLSTPFRSFRSMIFDPAYWLIGHRHYSFEQLRSFGRLYGIIAERETVRGATWQLIGVLNLYFSKWILRRQPLFKPFLDLMEDKELGSVGFMTVFVQFGKQNHLIKQGP